jgi:rhodanese-related sulfurtransferase
MPNRRVTPEEAAALMGEGWSYVDVRTIPEFDAGHPAGAYSVPLMQQGAAGRVANRDFVSVMEGAFGHDARIVVGCASGSRSRRAAEMLADAGFEHVAEMRAGFSGETDSMGRLVTPGWKASGLPTASAAEPGHRYQDLHEKAHGGGS